MLVLGARSHGVARAQGASIGSANLHPSRLALLAHLQQLATAMMALSSVGSWWLLPPHGRWLPGVFCIGVAVWLWRLPTR